MINRAQNFPLSVRLAVALAAAFVALAQVAIAQEPATAPAWGYEDTYQINVAGNLGTADSLINISNAGLHRTSPLALRFQGYICANVYVFDVDEQMIACCTCPISANGTQSFSARRDLVSNPLTPAASTSVTIKLVANVPLGGPTAPGSCNAAALPTTNLLAAIPPTAANFGGFASGMRAWGTHVHTQTAPSPVFTYGTETPFEQVGLSANEAAILNTYCGFIQQNGSNHGICGNCAQTVLGPAH
jgi:hypothetical protein